MEQITFEQLDAQKALESQPGRTAFIDECGSFGFDFSSEGNSEYYILCAIVIKNSEIENLRETIKRVKNNNGFQNGEMKSSKIDKYPRRTKIITELLDAKFEIFLLVADKQKFVEGSPLKNFKPSFIKYLHKLLYDVLHNSYQKLTIVEDEIGTTEFQESFKKYVKENTTKNLFGEYDFDYSDSKESSLVQLADIIAGSINRVYIDPKSPNYREMLKSKIHAILNFPNNDEPYFSLTNPEDRKYDKDIFDLAIIRANMFIEKYKQDISAERKLQICLLKYLKMYACNYNAQKYISSWELLNHLEKLNGQRIKPNYLYRRIIAPLRDEGVILASCSHGYKLPVCVEDITTYLNQSHTVIYPMLQRMGMCRNLIKRSTDEELDVFDNSTFIKYKNYFE
ncbi:MAG: DUF3800 domain-containing protein [Ruminococcaceae bacterium]|nr:DUF3800 domain-containing protein [Oscillospiraceae bacterium]